MRRCRAGEIAFVYQNNKRNKSITLASKIVIIICVWKIDGKGYIVFGVFVAVWLFLDKSIGEFSMLYKKCVL